MHIKYRYQNLTNINIIYEIKRVRYKINLQDIKT